MKRKMKQLVSWNEETKTVGVIGAFAEDEAEERLTEYVKERVEELFYVSGSDAADLVAGGDEDIRLNTEALTAEIVFPGGEYSEYLQVIDLPEAEMIGVDTRIGRLEAYVNNGPGQVGIDICLLTGKEPVDVIDVARASLWTDEADRTALQESSKDIRIMSFHDPYDEDYPDNGLHILRGSEIEDVCGAAEDAPDEEAGPGWKGADLVAYTDGSYNKATGNYGAGVVMFAKGTNTLPVFYKREGRAPEGENGWQVNGEIAAAKIAIEEAVKAGAAGLEIRYDYEGVEKWATGRWKRNKTYTREYAEYVRKAGEKLTVTFSHVKGHSGSKWNDMADTLAKKACGLED